jgi:hypothetical protein
MALLLGAMALDSGPARAGKLTAAAVNNATYEQSEGGRALALKTQILLDRKGFSPGVIDAQWGGNTRKAVRAFQASAGVNESGKLTRDTWQALAAGDDAPVLVEYQIVNEDTDGPFTTNIPPDLEAQSKLDRLGYRDARELLAEKFHMDEDLLRSLNPGQTFDKVGDRIVVASVRRPDGSAANGIASR